MSGYIVLEHHHYRSGEEAVAEYQKKGYTVKFRFNDRGFEQIGGRTYLPEGVHRLIVIKINAQETVFLMELLGDVKGWMYITKQSGDETILLEHIQRIKANLTTRD